MKTAVKYISLALGIMAISASCVHKELCFDHDVHAPKTLVDIMAQYQQEWELPADEGTDWEAEWNEDLGMAYDDLRPGIPSGLRVLIYNEDGTNSMLNLPPEGNTVSMRPGEHSILLYNNDTEYIVFDDLESYASARATTRTRTRSSYMGSPYLDQTSENTVGEPDMLYGSYVDSYYAERQTEVAELPVVMHPLVFRYLIRYEFSHGLEYVALARGALAGMAGAVWLNSGRTAEDAVTVLYDCTVEDFGAQAIVRTFGVPDYPNPLYPTRADRTYALNLEVMLKNGKTKVFDFDITEQIAAQPQGGIICVDGLEISDEEGKEGGSGFDVVIDGWGEYEDVELPLN